jgi:hypothetical protein
MDRPTTSLCRCEAIAGKPAWQTMQVHLWGIVLAGGDGGGCSPSSAPASAPNAPSSTVLLTTVRCCATR